MPVPLLPRPALAGAALDEPETIIQLDPLTRGNVIHGVLEEFLAANTAGGPPHGERATLHAQLRAIAERVLEEVEAAARRRADHVDARAHGDR